MSETEGLHFYVTCNPPLLPRGVDHVISSTRKALGGKVQSIMYEPELPGFMIISNDDDHDGVFEYVQNLLTSILDEDTDLADPDLARDLDMKGLRPDVEIVAEEPRVVPWPDYYCNDIPDYEDPAAYGNNVYPEAMHKFAEKLVWRGLEAQDGWNAGKLVDAVASFWRGRNAPVHMNEYEETLGCTLSWDSPATIIYLGADSCESEYLGSVARALGSLLEFFIHKHPTVKHVVLAEATAEVKTVFRRLGSLGLYKSTYLHPNRQTVANAYEELRDATALMTLVLDIDRRVAVDATRYPPSGPKPDVNERCELFGDYIYHSGTCKDIADWDEKKLAAFGEDVFQRPTIEPTEESHWPSMSITRWQAGLATAMPPSEDDYVAIEDAIVKPEGLQESAPRHLLDTEVVVRDLLGDLLPLQQPLVPHNRSEMALSNHRSVKGSMLEQTSRDMDLIDLRDSVSKPQAGAKNVPPNKAPAPDFQSLIEGFGNLKLRDGEMRRGLKSKGSGATCDQGQPMPSPSAINLSSPTTTGNDNQALGLRSTKGTARDLETQDTSILVPLPSVKIDPVMPRPPDAAQWDIWTSIKPELKSLCEILRMTPGNVALELHFGRISLTGVDPDQVHDGIAGSARTLVKTEKYLQSHCSDAPGFASVLSTCGADANAIPQIMPHDVGVWEASLHRRWVFYNFLCHQKGGVELVFTISVDADSFAPEVKAPLNELASVFIHCPRSAWDMKVTAVHSSSARETQGWNSYAAAIVESLQVTTRDKEPFLELVEEAHFPAVVDEIQVRQVAEYTNREHVGGILTVTMTKLMSLQKKGFGEGPSGGKQRLIANPRKPILTGARPSQWVEAKMSSGAGRRVLKGNEVLRLGEKAKWDFEELDREAVLDQLCWPAFGMISAMDRVGLHNDNKQTPAQTHLEPLPQTPKRAPAQKTVQSVSTRAAKSSNPYEFW